MTTPVAKAAIAGLIAYSTEETIRLLKPGLERLYSKVNSTPYSFSPEHEPHSQAESPENSATKVQGWMSNVEPISRKENQAQGAKTSKANVEARTGQFVIPTESERDTKASSTSEEMTHSSSANDKPEGWKTSLTITEIKVQEEEARKDHEAAHPHRGEQGSGRQAAHDQHDKGEGHQNQRKNRKAKTPHSQRTPPTELGTQNLYPSNNDGTVEAQATIKEHSQTDRFPDAAQPQAHHSTIQLVHQQPLPPCGIPGCPVKAPHERRAYDFKERKRPRFIEMLRWKIKKGTASKKEVEKVERFFRLHGDV